MLLECKPLFFHHNTIDVNFQTIISLAHFPTIAKKFFKRMATVTINEVNIIIQ